MFVGLGAFSNLLSTVGGAAAVDDAKGIGKIGGLPAGLSEGFL
jgi:hypothetical protein